MNEAEANQLLQKILGIDQVLYEQQLGLDFMPPTKKCLTQNDLVSYRNALAIVKKRITFLL